MTQRRCGATYWDGRSDCPREEGAIVAKHEYERDRERESQTEGTDSSNMKERLDCARTKLKQEGA